MVWDGLRVFPRTRWKVVGGWIDTVVVLIAYSFLHSLPVTHDFAKKKNFFLRKLVSAVSSFFLSISLKNFGGQVFLDSISADSWSESIRLYLVSRFGSPGRPKISTFLDPLIP